MFIAPLATAYKFDHSVVADSYVMNKRPRTDLCAQLAIRFRIANSYTRWRGIIKGHSQDGGRADFSLIKAFRMNLISAGSISLSSTFKSISVQQSIRITPLSIYFSTHLFLINCFNK